MLDQRRKCWAGVVQMLYICFVFAGFVVIFNSNISRYRNDVSRINDHEILTVTSQKTLDADAMHV